MEPELVDLSSSILDQHPDLRQMSVKLTAGVLCKCNVYTHCAFPLSVNLPVSGCLFL